MAIPVENITNLRTRYMTVVLTLDSGVFPTTGTSTKVITANSEQDLSNNQSDLAVSATINKSSGFMQQTADVTIAGLELADINAYSRFNMDSLTYISENTIEIYAGYSVGSNGYAPLRYKGQILTSAPNLNLPDRSRTLIISSLNAFYYQSTIGTTTNISGVITLDALFKYLANKLDSTLSYQSFKVTGSCKNPIYTGSYFTQLREATANYGYVVKLDGNTILIAPKNSAFSSSAILINADNGMIGYPVTTELGCFVRVWFNPAIQFGQPVQLESSLTFLNNIVSPTYPCWYINGLVDVIGNKTPQWESQLALNLYNFTLAT